MTLKGFMYDMKNMVHKNNAETSNIADKHDILNMYIT